MANGGERERRVDGPLMELLESRPTREYLISQLLLTELDLLACERLLTPRTTPTLRLEIGEQVEGLLAAKERLLAELGEP